MPNESIRSLLLQAISRLSAHRFDTTDASEKAKIDAMLASLQDQVGLVDQMIAVKAAAAICQAADDLTDVVNSARTGPFDDYVAEMSGMINRMRIAQEDTLNREFGAREFPKTEEESSGAQPDAHAQETAARSAPVQAPSTDSPAAARTPPASAPPSAAAERSGAAPASPAQAPPAIGLSKAFSDLQAEYAGSWKCSRIRPEKSS